MIGTGNNKYIGARYVPIIDGEWDALKDYESLTVVLFQGSSYTSKTNVPRGVQPVVGESSAYWALTGNYNVQVQEYKDLLEAQLAIKANFFPTLADMKSSSSLKEETICTTLGYFSPYDGGSATYIIKQKTETDIDNGGNIIVIGNLVAKLISDECNVKQFGAKGDGITDDSTAILTAFNNMKSVIVPSGVYFCNKEINITNSVKITGKGNPIIKFGERPILTDLYLIQLSAIDIIIKDITFEIVGISNPTFKSQESTAEGLILVKGNRCDGLYINNCNFYVKNEGSIINATCLWLVGTTKNVKIENCKMINSSYSEIGGVFWGYGLFDNVSADNCYFAGTQKDEIIGFWNTVTATVLSNVTLNNCTVLSIEDTVGCTNAISSYAKTSLTLNNCKVISKKHLTFVLAKVNQFSYLVFNNCYIDYDGYVNGSTFYSMNGSDSKITVNSCQINFTSNTVEDAFLIRADGDVDFSNNLVTITNIKLGRTKANLFWLNSENANVSITGNKFELIKTIDVPFNTVYSLTYNYNTLNIIGNTFNNNNPSNIITLTNYTQYTSAKTRTLKSKLNIFINVINGADYIFETANLFVSTSTTPQAAIKELWQLFPRGTEFSGLLQLTEQTCFITGAINYNPLYGCVNYLLNDSSSGVVTKNGTTFIEKVITTA